MNNQTKPSGITCPFCGSEVWDMEPEPMVVPDLNSDNVYLKMRVRCVSYKCSLSSYRVVNSDRIKT